MKSLSLSTILLLSVFILKGINLFGNQPAENRNKKFENLPEIEEIFNSWAESYIGKIPVDFADTINLHLKDNDSHWHIIFSDGNYVINKGKNPLARIIITAYYSTYKKIHDGELNAMTAIGRASIHDAAPLDMWLENGMTFRKIDWDYAYFTVINFFNSNPHNKLLIGREHARKIHGGHAVALYYTEGFRSAYYNIIRGELLNESGEKDPFNQSFIIIQGHGYAKIGNDTLKIKANEAYYIKPNLEHKVWTDSEEGLSLIWNAWGNEAW